MFTLNCRGRLLVINQPIVMGILNITPDSFHAASRARVADEALALAGKMLAEGATILDIGGQSSRPGSATVSEAEEMARVLDITERLTREFPQAYFSIDTFYGRVAEEAVNRGVCIVNDISAGVLDPGMWPTVAQLRVPYVLMHMQGTPQTMQNSPQYHNVKVEVLDFFIHTRHRLQEAGIHDVIVDPGFGFGKTIAHNFQLLRELDVLQVTGAPLLVGLSRKSGIAKTLDVDVSEALNGTTVAHTIALMKGASILRAHDVKEAVEAIKLVEAVRAS